MIDSITPLLPNTLLNHGLPLIGGGVMGFVFGYVVRKLMELAIIGLGSSIIRYYWICVWPEKGIKCQDK